MLVTDRNIKVKRGYIYLEKYRKGRYIRCSTHLIANDENMAYVRENARDMLIREWNKLDIPDSYKIDYENVRKIDEYISESFEFFLETELHHVKEVTAIKYQSIFHSFQNDFKHKRTANLTGSDLEYYASVLDQKGESKASIRSKIGLLVRVINHHRKHFKLAFIEKIDIARFGKDKKEANPFSEKEAKTLLANAKNAELQKYLQIASNTGMRTGEILALQKSDIDLENNTINVNKTLNQIGKVTLPKTKSSIRKIPIINPNFKKFLESIYNNLDGRVVNIGIKKLKALWTKLLKDSNIDYRNIYQLRHTFATLMIQKTNEILSVSYLLGHKNANITLDTYAKAQINHEKFKNVKLNF